MENSEPIGEAMFDPSSDFDLAAFVAFARATGTDVQDIEVKSSAEQLPKALAQTLSAFSNTSGGVIVLGLDEREGFTAARGFDARRIQDALGQMCSDKLEPPVRARIELVEFEGSTVVVAIIPEMPPFSKPCYVKAKTLYDGSYVRVGDGDRRLSRYEVDRILEGRRQPRYDEEIVDEATRCDLDDELVNGYLARARAMSPRVFGKLADDDALLCGRVLKRDKDGVLRPTLAGLMALGFYPQQFYPRLGISFAVFPGTSKEDLGYRDVRFLDSKSVIGPIPVLISETLAALRRNMKTVSYMDGAFRVEAPEYPDDAVREALANALMHRDYSPEGRGSAVQVNMFSDRLEILNVGGLYGGMTVDRLGQYGFSATRNERLSTILEMTPYASGEVERGFVVENKGTGYAQIKRSLAKAGMPAPVARDDIATFTLTLRKRDWNGGQDPTTRAMQVPSLRSGTPARTKPTLRPVQSAPQPQPAADHGTMRVTVDGDQEWIIDWLHVKGPSKAADIAAGLGVSRATVVRKLNALCQQGLVKRDGRPRSPELTYSLVG